jgi:predicted CoA-substrate-specific enzyme activase
MNRQTQQFAGLEIGAVSVKWVCQTTNGEKIAHIMRHGGDPKNTVQLIVDSNVVGNCSAVVITGHTAKSILDLPYRSETECLEKALAFHGLKPDILLSLGGETFSIYPLKDGLIKNIISTSKCAAGTGEFIVQQFRRMGFSLEDGLKECLGGKIVPLATRCSVHCKSDATHKLNKGECCPGDIAKSLIYDLARKVGEMVEALQSKTHRIVISGGVSKNEIFIENFRRILNESEVIVLPESHYLEAFGALLYAAELTEKRTVHHPGTWFKSSGINFELLPPLSEAKSLLDYRAKMDNKKEIIDGASYILGVDAGSTTTKAVLMNVAESSVDASHYLRTLGNPVIAVKECLKELIKQVGGKTINIIRAGVTGSAREMVSVYLNNCMSFNEILAHARAAAEEVPEVDTVFEIGGQDSKFISFQNGVPVDYAMNEGCSAGTGSFLEESAFVDMDILVKEISSIAMASKNPIAFGERCAAFINTDIRNALQQGAGRDDVIAGLVYSIADNYISRIVGARHVGKNLLFIGGVALNKSVALAMAFRTKQKIIVPAHPELMGCVGTALMLRDRLNSADSSEATCRLEELVQGDLDEKVTFRCKVCENTCEIRRISIREKVYPFGGLCSRYELLRHSGSNVKEGQDLVAFRNRIMFEEFGPRPVKNPHGKIGLPMALTTFELYPFYAKLINELGYDVVLSNPSKAGNSKTTSAICYPCEVVHGAVYDLMNRGVDFIFLPHLIEMEIPERSCCSYTCPSTATIPDIIRATFKNYSKKVLSPHIGLSKNLIKTTIQEIGRMGAVLGFKKSFAEKAGRKALAHYGKFREKYNNRGMTALKNLSGENSVVIAGRPYTTCSPELNLALPRKIISRGYHAIPADLLPLLDTGQHPGDPWNFTQQIGNAVAYIKNYPNLFICFVSCFSCGPDAIMYHYIRRELAGHTFCYLEIDSHTAHAGFETRISAFLDIIEEKKCRKVSGKAND